MAKYHKYVFDLKNRKFVGTFEKMYKNEERNNFDSWFQEDLRDLATQIAYTILHRYNFSNILDAGCGKGTFVHQLKKKNNYVRGIDLSPTAIKKARAKYPDIDFEVGRLETMRLGRKFDLVIIKETLSYSKDWKKIIKKASSCKYALISLSLVPNPIGFVKTSQELRNEIARYFKPLVDLTLFEKPGEEIVIIFGQNKRLRT